MKWYIKILIVFTIISFIISMGYREYLIRQSPSDVRYYQNIMRKISSPEYIEKFQNYTGLGKEGEPNMHFAVALQYLGERLEYTEEFIERHEDPIEILEYGKGRCGEFAIAYTALLISNGWKTRFISDVSSGVGNGDHIWVEVLGIPPLKPTSIVLDWVHVDPTEGAVWTQQPSVNAFECPYIDNPYMYERDWEKELTEVWGIEPDFAERVEENYQWEG